MPVSKRVSRSVSVREELAKILQVSVDRVFIFNPEHKTRARAYIYNPPAMAISPALLAETKERVKALAKSVGIKVALTALAPEECLRREVMRRVRRSFRRPKDASKPRGLPVLIEDVPF